VVSIVNLLVFWQPGSVTIDVMIAVIVVFFSQINIFFFFFLRVLQLGFAVLPTAL